MLRQQTTYQRYQHRHWLLLIAFWVAHSPAAGSPSLSSNAADGTRTHFNQVDVLRQEIRTNLAGDLYLPTTTERVPGIILLGGSDGEPMPERSALLASNAYVVLNLFYFGHGSLPKQFAEVPVEYLTNAVSCLQSRERVDPARICVIGHSRLGSRASAISSAVAS